MPRPQRLELPHSTYYIMNRSRGGRLIFNYSDDYERFLSFMGEVASVWRLKLWAYCFLPNQYHLLLRTTHANLSRSLHQLHSRFALAMKFTRNNQGGLFQRRYKATLIEEQEYLRSLISYLHLLPTHAGTNWPKAETYPWSSARFYSGTASPPTFLSVLPTDSQPAETDRDRASGVDHIFQKERWPRVLGTLPFKFEIKEALCQAKREMPPPFSEVQIRIALTRLVGMEWDAIRQPKTRDEQEARRVAIMAFRRFLNWDYRQIAVYFHASSLAHISRIVNGKECGATTLRLWERIREELESPQCLVDTSTFKADQGLLT